MAGFARRLGLSQHTRVGLFGCDPVVGVICVSLGGGVARARRGSRSWVRSCCGVSCHEALPVLTVVSVGSAVCLAARAEASQVSDGR